MNFLKKSHLLAFFLIDAPVIGRECPVINSLSTFGRSRANRSANVEFLPHVPYNTCEVAPVQGGLPPCPGCCWRFDRPSTAAAAGNLEILE